MHNRYLRWMNDLFRPVQTYLAAIFVAWPLGLCTSSWLCLVWKLCHCSCIASARVFHDCFAIRQLLVRVGWSTQTKLIPLQVHQLAECFSQAAPIGSQTFIWPPPTEEMPTAYQPSLLRKLLHLRLADRTLNTEPLWISLDWVANRGSGWLIKAPLLMRDLQGFLSRII